MNLPALPKPTPWRVRGLALLAGLAAALAHPPFGVLPGLLGYAVLLWLLDTIDGPRPLRSAFLRGWLMGLSYFALSTWWIAEAFMVDAANQGWMAPFAVAAMAAGMALFWGLGALLYRLIRPAGVRRVLVFAGAFALLEWTRGHILTGFPWNLPGETWRAGSAVSQFAGVVGAYGLTWITLAIAAVPAVWRDGKRGRIAVGAAVVALVGLFVGGSLALSRPPSAPGPALTVRVVQADIPQESKWDAQRFAQIVQAYVSLTAKPYAGKPADIVVWPEGALPLAINDYMVPGSWVRQDIVAALRPGQLMLLGGYRYEGPPDKPVYYNSLVALRRTADDVVVVGIYDKHRLVPFGEYLPADALMTRIGFKSMAHLGDGFATGPKPAPLRVAPDLLVQPLICYESLFPRLAKPVPGVRAIVNVSNDAWFGVTSGPLQHLNLASYRAIETGLPLIRATPTGVSALIDARGRILPGARLKLGESGVIDGKVSEVGSPTLFSKLGHWPFGLLLLVSFLAAIRVPGGRGLEKGLN
ncbi:apolipoprotein N-acyltransferase [Caulobacter sp. UNC358MFTsu5.1]|uniref:apolipoprotein N-acyltransferase n=1 Tax=Caulobacter sp. UNC358MFTsu5.1 TaxID=1449049 RepID=UPI0004A75C63|nr:apolipoprotein N-acyltransferase [Caulobacter sp. UNC358MFTsu5.1]